jgi:hypothetical protein
MQLDVLIANFLTLIIVALVVLLLVNAIFLGIALGMVNGKNRELGTTFVTALLMAVVGWIPCIGCILSLYFIKSRHELGWGGAIGAYILTIIIAIVVIFAILFIFFAPLIAALFGVFPFP